MYFKGRDFEKKQIYAFEKVLYPIMRNFEPELVIISAGFDAGLGDPIGEFALSPDCYAYMTKRLEKIAKNKRVIAILEGGYNVQTVAMSSEAVLRVLLGEELPLKNSFERKTIKQWKHECKPNELAVHQVKKAVKFLRAVYPFLRKPKQGVQTATDILTKRMVFNQRNLQEPPGLTQCLRGLFMSASKAAAKVTKTFKENEYNITDENHKQPNLKHITAACPVGLKETSNALEWPESTCNPSNLPEPQVSSLQEPMSDPDNLFVDETSSNGSLVECIDLDSSGDDMRESSDHCNSESQGCSRQGKYSEMSTEANTQENFLTFSAKNTSQISLLVKREGFKVAKIKDIFSID